MFPFRPTPSFLRALALVLGVAATYLGLGRLAFAASVNHDIVTLVVFGAEGVALGSVLRWGNWSALGVFLGQLLLALSTGLPLAPSLAVSTINASECLLGGWAGRKVGFDPDLNRLRDVLFLIGGSVLLLQPFSALAGVGVLWGLDRIPTAALPMSGFSWWMGNVLGQCIVAPAVLVLSKPPKAWMPWPLLNTGLLVLLGLLGFGLLGGSGSPSFALALALFFPLVVFMAVGFGVEGGALAGLGLSAVAVGITSLGRGPFRASWVELDLFLVGGILTGLILGALFTERRRMEGQLREQNEALGQANAKLSHALEEVQTLAGLLPICAYCKQIRDDKGYWNGIEDYLAQHAQFHFTHGICPGCREKFLRESQKSLPS